MNRVQRQLAAIFIVASLFGAASCVTVPTSGPIESVEGQQPGCQNCVNVEVAPPAVDAEPREIVEGYLRATSNYQPNYSVARQFLTRTAAEKWSPEAGVLVYRGSPVAAGEKVTFDGTLVGALASDRSYAAHDKPLKWNFGLHKEVDGQWRIDNPPPGLMVDEFWFKSFYQPYDVYFVGNGRSLVPDRIYLPALSNPANVASALMKALLDGPSKWLRPAVSSAIPPNTSLSVDSVTITDNGMAEVPLSDSVMALTDPQRTLLAAQIVYTLRQIGGVKGVLIKANQQPYRVPGSDPGTLAISVDAIPRDLDPIPFVASEQLYAVQNRLVTQVTTTSDSATVGKLPGPLGERNYAIDALAVSVTNTDLAITTNGRTMLQRAPIALEGATQPSPLLSGKEDLLRPQFTRYGEIWVIGREGDRQRIWMFTADEKKFVIDSPALGDQKVKAFKISPDGTRMALIRTNTESGNDEVELAQIIRSDKVTVAHRRTLNTVQTNMPAIRRIQDVAWLDATELLVLGASDAAATMFAPFSVVVDSSRITAYGEPQTWKATELTVLHRTQSAVIVDGAAPRKTWKYDGNQWLSFVDKGVTTAAYPG